MKSFHAIDKKITGQRDFKTVVSNVLKNMFRVQIYPEIRKIYVDLNSCLSILFRYENINSPDITEAVSSSIENFLQKYLGDSVQVVILFTLEPSKVHIETYPEWCKERNERVDYGKSGFLQTLILSLNNFAKVNPLIKIVNHKAVHPAMVIYNAERLNRKEFCVLSKDAVIQCLPLKNMHIWTGVNYIEMDDPDRVLPDNITLPEPISLYLPFYMTIRGDARNEFKGVGDGYYGPQRTVKYINENKLKIKTGLSHPLKEHCDRYLKLYEINNMLEANKEEIRTIS